MANLSLVKGFSAGSAGTESTCNEGDLGSIPELGRSLGEGNSYPLQYFPWQVPWAVWSMGSQRVGHAEWLSLHFIPLVEQLAISVSKSSSTVTMLFLSKCMTLLRSQKNNTILTFEGKTMTKCDLIHPIHIYILYIYIHIYIHTHIEREGGRQGGREGE